MKIASFRQDIIERYGVVTDKGIVSASDGFLSSYPTLHDVLDADALGQLAEDTQARDSDYLLDDVQLLPPITNPERVFCVGINYPKRYPLDNPAPPPEHIILFAKLPGTLVGHSVSLEIPQGDAADTFDYEGEIGVVIGKAGRHISEQDALDYIAGYTVINDGSVRGWQKHSVHAGKNFANSSACGPWMVTPDEIGDPASIHLSTRLNNETVQDTSSAEMVFSIAEVIAYISHTIDLRPGDLIATGSPEGAGGSLIPPRFLREGDVLEIEVSGVGILRNKVGHKNIGSNC